MREFSPVAVIVGILIGVLFGAANAYIGLKVGMTVSASIPAAVMALAIMRGLLKRNSVLESNMVQTIGSVGESLAAGMIFTIPALFIFASVEQNADLRPSFAEVAIWGAIGGLLGVLFMVPLRRMLIVKEHGKLPYPEGVACAEVLQSGERGGASAKTVFGGLIVGGVYQLIRGLGFFRDEATQRIPLLKTEASLAAEPALLGVGYILGARIAGFMLSGAVLGWFVIIPLIYYFGESAGATFAPAETPVADLEPGDLWNFYLRYIGAGAVILGGVVSLFRSLGTIGSSVLNMFSFGGSKERTDRDIPTFLLLLMIAGIGCAMYYLPALKLQNLVAIVCIIVFAFFFVTVSSRLVGVVGSSSNPISGMTIATVLATALIFVNFMGDSLTPTQLKITIISVGAIVCISAAIAGDCSQDLKTGFLVKATPWKQQVGELLGVLTAISALAILIIMIDDNPGFKTNKNPDGFLAPQANLMQLLVQGVVDQELPWGLIGMGIAAALLVELLGIPSLPFAVGLYLPLSLSTPIMVGGILRWLIDKRRGSVKEGENPGILGASGLVAGQGLVGVAIILVISGVSYFAKDARYSPSKFNEDGSIKQTTEAVTALDVRTAVFLQDDGTSQADDDPLQEVVEELDDELRAIENDVDAAGTEVVAAVDEDEAEPKKGKVLSAKMFQDWLFRKMSVDPHYGLRTYEYVPDEGLVKIAIDDEGKRVVAAGSENNWVFDFWKLLPLLPFGLLVLWLGIVASKRLPDDGAPATSQTPWGPPPQRPTPNDPDPFGGVDTKTRETQPQTKPSENLDYEAWGPARAAEPSSSPATVAPAQQQQPPVSTAPPVTPAPAPVQRPAMPTPQQQVAATPPPAAAPTPQPAPATPPAQTQQPAPQKPLAESAQQPSSASPSGPIYVKKTPSPSATAIPDASASRPVSAPATPTQSAQSQPPTTTTPSTPDAATPSSQTPPPLPPRPAPPADRGYPKPPPLPGSPDAAKPDSDGD